MKYASLIVVFSFVWLSAIVGGMYLALSPEEELFLSGDVSVNLQTLILEMEATKDVKGDYVQVLKDGTIDRGKAFDKSNLPPNTYINVYRGKDGSGYQVVTEYDDRIEYIGFGYRASDYTKIIFKPVISVSTST